ncbi:MAG: hypothetical protein A2X34_08835, partial [Elusimicrobia bacterium GWC2_51_8]
QDFAEKLSEFRLQLARHIWNSNKDKLKTDPDQLGYLTQVILDRIIFIRVAESKGVEEDGLLKSFIGDGFWSKFQKASGIEFLKHYDGPMFNGESIFDQIVLDDSFFHSFIESLYYPSPYRFDVMPVKLLSDTYETFLDKKIVVQGGSVKEILRPEYEKAGGAVSTPEYIVRTICQRTLAQALQTENIESILNLKLLDPACGSGTFIGVIFDILEEKILSLQKARKISVEYADWFTESETGTLLTVLGKRELIRNCIYGVDLSSEAVEVARMSLAFKVLENAERYPYLHGKIGLHGNMILLGIGENIRHGNSLVEQNIFEIVPTLKKDLEELTLVRPFSYKKAFHTVFSRKDPGFNAIVGNPPYVEVKWLKGWSPSTHEYLKSQYATCEDGKVDLAVPFIERSLELLNKTGRLGFIIQKRLFKTEYGANLRKLISSMQSIEQVLDFQSSSVFMGRMTYVAIIVLGKDKTENLYYHLLTNDPPELTLQLAALPLPSISPESYDIFPSKRLGAAPWDFGDPKMIEMRDNLLHRIGNLKQLLGLNIGVGLQMLWVKAYHLRPTQNSVTGKILEATNGFRDILKIETSACRPLMCNEKFYTFKPNTPDVFGIFPYDIESGESKAIPFSIFRKRFPHAGGYLSKLKEKITGSVETPSGKDLWHTYTREQNLVRQPGSQVLVPMTAKDTFATCDRTGELYCDNANVNFLKVEDADTNTHLALAAIINSTTFSVLARLGANPQSGGHFKFNKQFLWPIPFPSKNFISNSSTRDGLASLTNNIERTQRHLIAAHSSKKEPLKQLLNHYWEQLDTLVEDLYKLTKNERTLIQREGRATDRREID